MERCGRERPSAVAARATTFGTVPLGIVGDRAIFANSSAGEIWGSDGTPAGTRDVALPGGAFPVGDFVHFGDDVLFSCFAPGHGHELCVVDAAGTGLQGLVEIAPGAEHSYARFLTATADALYFRATDGVHGYELWRLNRDRIFASAIE